MSKADVDRAKTRARELGWEEWEAGRTNNAFRLWEKSDIKTAELLNLELDIEKAYKIVHLSEDAPHHSIFDLLYPGDESKEEQLKKRKEIVTLVPGIELFLKGEKSLGKLLQDLTTLPEGRVGNQDPSTGSYRALIRELVILAATRDR